MGNFFTNLEFYIRFGSLNHLMLFISIFSTYIFIKILLLSIHQLRTKNPETKKAIINICKTALYISVGAILFAFIAGTELTYVNTAANVDTVIRNNGTLMNLEYALFGGNYVSFWFQSTLNPLYTFFSGLSVPIVLAYRALPLMLGVLFTVLLIKNERLFIQGLLAFALALFIAFPGWYFFPATTPLDGYYHNLTHTEFSTAINNYIATYNPTAYLASFLERVRIITGSGIIVTTLPSMHIAWSVIILYFGYKAWRPLLIVLIPYFTLNMIATMYTLQHYALDIPTGLLGAILAIYLSTKITEYIKFPSLSKLTLMVREDLQKIPIPIIRRALQNAKRPL